jgi:transcriptional regulator with XRE-family HTH domain
MTTPAGASSDLLGLSIVRIRIGAALQRHRLQRGLTQDELAEFTDLSLKYVGEIERGEANFTIDKLERLAAAVGWDPLEVLEGVHEPLSEGVRVLVLDEIEKMLTELRNMKKWLQALDPALRSAPRATAPERSERAERRGRPSRSERAKKRSD